jgi:hypothetical protein
MSSASMAETKLDSSILSFDGKEFVRTDTTLMQDGQSAVGTKLDHDSPAYKALITPGPRPFSVKTTKATTHRSSGQTAK